MSLMVLPGFLGPKGSASVTALKRDHVGDPVPGSVESTAVTPPGVAASVGLIAAYGFDEASGTIVVDASGNAQNGAIVGATRITAGKYGNALSFNGTSNYVNVPDSNLLDLTTGMTLSAWVNPTALVAGAWRNVIIKQRAGGEVYNLYANSDTNAPIVYVVRSASPGAPVEAHGATQIPLNTWSYLTATYDGTTLRLYVNAAQVGSRAVSGALLTSTGALRIGGNSIWGEFFKGLIDEVRVYNRALSATEIQTDMNTAITGAPSDTQAPTVSISSPSNGATLSSAITVTANAADNVGVAGVQFQLDGANLGAEDTTSPYSVNWDTATTTNGSHSLTAVARDVAGNQGTSTQVNVTVSNITPPSDTQPPAVSISSPSSGSTVSNTITVMANASDNVGVAGVQFQMDGANLGAEDTTSPYSVNWDTTTTSNGAHILTAVARDAAGNQATSSQANVTVSNAVPPPASGLVAAYAFAEGSGTVAVDFTGNGQNGTIVGATWTSAGKFGNALSFNGTSNYVNVPDSNLLDLTTGMTLSAWVNPTALVAGAWRNVIIKERAGGEIYNLYANSDTNAPIVYVVRSASPNAPVEAHGATQIPLNAWSYLTATYDGTTLRLYVNAAQVGSQAVSGALLTSTGALRIGGNSIWGEFFKGLIDEVRVYNRGLSATEIQTDMNTPIGGAPPPPPPPDTQPPTVSITSPSDGATVSSAITVTANAADNVGVAGVQFQLDGADLGQEATTSPYSVTWDTATTTNGSHSLTAVARDQAGNLTTSSPVSVTVSNAGSPTDPSQIGRWGGSISWPIVGIHASLMHTGKVLFMDGRDIGGTSARVWNPATGVFTPVPIDTNHFCSGHAAMADGRIMVLGGHINDFVGIPDVNIFDPVSQTWTSAAPMGFARWYPTVTALADGRMLASSGTITCQACPASTPEVYNPATNSWAPLSSAIYTLPIYPFMFVLPDGRVLYAGTVEDPTITRVLNVATQTWTTVNSTLVEGGTSVMYQPGKVMKCGTAVSGESSSTPTIATTYVLDMNQPSPAWRQTASMAFPRGYANVTALPDGTVIVTGGGRTRAGGDIANAVYQAEIWSPITETWKTVDSMHNPRLYHSTALLLPDARVLVAGGGRAFGNDQLNAEIYSPPYLFKGPRPTISSAPANVQYGSSFFLGTPNAASIASVSLIAPASVTHDYNENQRFMNLTFQQAAGGLTIQAPASGNLAPPGYDMLFIVDSNGVPSVASFVKLSGQPSGDLQAPTVSITSPTDGATVANTVTISATATDNVGVVGVQFKLDGVDLGAEDASEPYSFLWNSTTVTNGPHTISAVARDAAGNTQTATISVTTSNTSPPPPPGLVAAYGFEEGGGITTVDATGNGQNATVSQATWTSAGKFGNALSFNGAFSYVTVADSNLLDLTTGMTLSAWIYPTAINSGEWRNVIIKERTGGEVYNLYANVDTNQPAVFVVAGSGPGTLADARGTNSIHLDTWTHLAATYDGATLRIYVNGVQVGSRAVSGSLLTSTGALRIGGNGVWGEFFKGTIDEVKVYNRALSAAEIQSDMTTPVQP
jgi:hypothetical protein